MDLSSYLDVFWGVFRDCVTFLNTFTVFGFPISYIIIRSFVLGYIIDAVILKA